MVHVCCVKVGDKYTSDYVNILEAMVKRHLKIEHEFLCITDDPTGVNCRTIKPTYNDGWWTKLSLFQKNAYGMTDFLYLDLDVVIVDNIDCFFHGNDFTIIQDWWTGTYNSSVFRVTNSSERKVWDKFIKDDVRIKKRLHGDQDWITQRTKAKVWPEEWCLSYKAHHLEYNPGGKIVIFHGKPDPHECGGWVRDYWCL